MKENLREYLKELKLEYLDNQAIDNLEHYYQMLVEWNRHAKFIKGDEGRILTHHIIDSLTASYIIKGIPSGSDIIDIGSGPGLPGIPLAICHPDKKFTLVEPINRKVGFLHNVVNEIPELRNTSIMSCSFQEIHNCYDLITCRAFQPMSNKLLKNFIRLLRSPNEGKILLYKGTKQKIEEELGSLQEVIYKSLPQKISCIKEERHLVIIEKCSN